MAANEQIAEHHRAVHENGIETVREVNAGDQDEAMYLFEPVVKASEGVIACPDLLIAESSTRADAEPAVGEKRMSAERARVLHRAQSTRNRSSRLGSWRAQLAREVVECFKYS